jgi:hypothetical protein
VLIAFSQTSESEGLFSQGKSGGRVNDYIDEMFDGGDLDMIDL